VLRVGLRPALACATVALGFASCWAAPAGAYIFWGAGNAIGRADLDGSGVEPSLITGTGEDNGIAADGHHVFWANEDSGTIGRANLDGSDPEQSFITGAHYPEGVAVNGQYVYWTNSDAAAYGTGNTIGRANLNGTDVNQDFINTGMLQPFGVAVDSSYIYWSTLNGYGPDTIGRANLDGGGVNESFIPGPSQPWGLAAGIGGGYVYWADVYGGTIGRANYNGTGATNGFISGQEQAQGLAVDGSYIYWTDYSGDIGRAAIDGSAVNESFIPGGVFGLALDPVATASAMPTVLQFGTQLADTPPSAGPAQMLTVHNTSSVSLQITQVQVTSGATSDFAITHDTCLRREVAVGGMCTMSVRFAASVTGPDNAVLTVTTGNTYAPLQIPLDGMGAIAVSPSRTLSGIPRDKPKLAFTLAAAKGSPLTTVAVTVMQGLRFSSAKKDLAEDVKVSGPGGRAVPIKATVNFRLNALTIKLQTPTARPRVTVVSPELQASKRLVGGTRKPGRVVVVPVTIKATNTQLSSLTLSDLFYVE